MTETIPTPALGGLAVALLLGVGGWLIASSRDKDGLPRTGTTRLGAFLAFLGLLAGLLAIPGSLPSTTLAAVLLAVLLGGLGLLRAASRQAIGWTALGEVATTAVGLAWAGPGRVVVSLLSLAAGLSAAVWLTGEGLPLATFLGALVILAPARWWMLAAFARERTRTKVERAFAGLLLGGEEWSPQEAGRRGAPLRIRFDAAQNPARIVAPLPPSWSVARTEDLEREVHGRLRNWGPSWLTAVDASRRLMTVQRGAVLPDLVTFAGQAACGHKVTLGLARISKAAAAAGLGHEGAVVPFTWDLSDSPAGLIAGTAGGGKSVLVRLLIVQAAMAGWQVWLIDPKRVEMTPFRGRKGITAVATSVTEIRDTMQRLRAEMERRYDLLQAAGRQKMDELPAAPPPILVVVDEAFELMVKDPGSDDATKEENEMRMQIAGDARKIAAMARAADLHEVLLAQRADAEVIKGSLQNNLPFRALMRPLTAGSTARNMIGLNEVENLTGNPRGRAVMKTDLWPESEVQVAYLDAEDLDRWLPKVRAGAEGGERAEAEAATDPEAPKNPDQPAAESHGSKPQDGGQVPSGKPGRSKPESGPGADPESGEDPQQIEWDFMKDFGDD